jgi:hypothetical protein
MRAEQHLIIRRCKWVKLSKELWYGNVPKSVQTSGESAVTIVWNQQVPTDRMNPSNRLRRYNPIKKKEHMW